MEFEHEVKVAQKKLLLAIKSNTSSYVSNQRFRNVVFPVLKSYLEDAGFARIHILKGHPKNNLFGFLVLHLCKVFGLRDMLK